MRTVVKKFFETTVIACLQASSITYAVDLHKHGTSRDQMRNSTIKSNMSMHESA